MTIKWSEKAIDAAIKGWFGKWASDEERMRNALEKAIDAQGLSLCDLATYLAFESGYNEAATAAHKIATETIDPYDPNNDYCKGVCDAAYGIAREIKLLRK